MSRVPAKLGQGLGVDSAGGPVIDPTANVLDKVEDAVTRLDDLRVMSDRLADEKIKRLEGAVQHQKDLALQRAEYDVRLAVAEAKRIDAIRAVDVNAVQVASQRASDQASVLAAQVAQSADALRGLVATTAAAAASSQQQVVNTLNDRLTRLEQAQYKGEGKQAVNDPAMQQLEDAVRKQGEFMQGLVGSKQGTSAVWAAVLAVVSALGGAVGIAALMKMLGR